MFLHKKVASKVASSYMNKYAKRGKLIIVDVQPAYDRSIRFNLSQFMEFVSTFKDVLVFYNGYDTLGMDTEDQVIEYFLKNGLPEHSLMNFDLIDKGYGFFRSWMDNGVDERTIIKAIRHLILTRNNDSRDIDEEEWISVLGEDKWEDWMDSDPLIIPDIAIRKLRSFSGALIAGGAKEECLKELQLFMSALNIRAKEVKKFIY